ncbi:hypothetical protein GCM10027432_10020 [Lysobacter fragariae]
MALVRLGGDADLERGSLVLLVELAHVKTVHVDVARSCGIAGSQGKGSGSSERGQAVIAIHRVDLLRGYG